MACFVSSGILKATFTLSVPEAGREMLLRGSGRVAIPTGGKQPEVALANVHRARLALVDHLQSKHRQIQMALAPRSSL